jgi:hypothetical protein
MTKLVDTYARTNAVRAARAVVKHQGNRVWDEVVALDEVIDKDDPLAVIGALHKIRGLIGGMKVTVQVWANVKQDLLAHPKDEPTTLEIPAPPAVETSGTVFDLPGLATQHEPTFVEPEKEAEKADDIPF